MLSNPSDSLEYVYIHLQMFLDLLTFLAVSSILGSSGFEGNANIGICMGSNRFDFFVTVT